MRSDTVNVQENRNYVAKPGFGPLPEAHPINCKSECPYGKGRSFCWPCMYKILSEHRAGRAACANA